MTPARLEVLIQNAQATFQHRPRERRVYFRRYHAARRKPKALPKPKLPPGGSWIKFMNANPEQPMAARGLSLDQIQERDDQHEPSELLSLLISPGLNPLEALMAKEEAA